MENSINIMTKRLEQILEGKEPSIYLFGSVVLDDYRHGWSDIDIVCFTKEPISKQQADQLVMLRQMLLSEYPGNSYFRHFEGVIGSRDVLIRHEKDTVVYWGTSGQRILDSFTIDVFSMIEIIKYAKLLSGTDIRALMQVPQKADIRNAVMQHYQTIRSFAAKTNDSFYSAGWFLDIARCLYSLEKQDVISKTQAGIWALNLGVAPEPEYLKTTIMIRENPGLYQNDKAISEWFCSLGPHIQLFADVLQVALEKTAK
jgi:hypothetical protein